MEQHPENTLNQDLRRFNDSYGPTGKATAKELGSSLLEITLEIPIHDLLVGKEMMAVAWGLDPNKPITVVLRLDSVKDLYPHSPTVVDYLDIGTAPRVEKVFQSEEGPANGPIDRQLTGILKTHLARLWRHRRFQPPSRDNSLAEAAPEVPLNEHQHLIYLRLTAENQLEHGLARQAAALATDKEEALLIYIALHAERDEQAAASGGFAADPETVLVPYRKSDGLLGFVAGVVRKTLPILNTMCPGCGKLHRNRDLPLVPIVCNEHLCQQIPFFFPIPTAEATLGQPQARVAAADEPRPPVGQLDGGRAVNAAAPSVRQKTLEVLKAFGSQRNDPDFFVEFPRLHQQPTADYALVRHTPTGQLAMAKVVDLPTTETQLRLLAVDLATKFIVSPAFTDPRASLTRLLALRHNDNSLCVVTSMVRATPIPQTLHQELQLAYPKVTATNWGFTSNIENWVANGIIPCNALRPYIVLKQLHKAGLTIGNITPASVVVGLQFTTSRDCDNSDTLRVEEKWSTMIVDLDTVCSAIDGPMVGRVGTGTAPVWEKKIRELPLELAVNRPGLERLTGDMDCGVVFATLLFGENPFHRDREASARDWPFAPRFERLFREARETHGMLWEPLLMRLLPERGNQVACPRPRSYSTNP